MEYEGHNFDLIQTALGSRNNDEQFWQYCWDQLGSLPLICLWDQCILYARAMYYENQIPDC
ncbi:hypothetical protein NP603_17425, partial [Methylomonas sp. SURF-1]